MVSFQSTTVAALLLVAAEVDAFSTTSPWSPAILRGQHRHNVPNHPSEFRLPTSTSLGYRNSPHDTGVDYYAILGVSRAADGADIKRAFRGLAKQFHPDANPDMDTTAVFQELNRAYEVLKDPDLKAQYDQFGMAGLGTSAASDKNARARPEPTQPWTPPRGTVYTNNRVYTNVRNSEPVRNDQEQRQYQQKHYQQSRQPFSGGRRQNPDFGYKPFNEPYDPWKTPFDELYNARIEEMEMNQKPSDSFFETAAPFGGNSAHAPETIVEPKTVRKSDSASRKSAGRSGSRQRWVGGDLCIELEIDMATAIEGGEERIRIKQLATCHTCSGSGIPPGAEVKICDHCGGTGAVVRKMEFSGRSATNNYSPQEICSHCGGTGQKVADCCGTCGGKGTVEVSKRLSITIPPGVQDGDKLRLKGAGDAGPMGGPPGDLFIFLTVTR